MKLSILQAIVLGIVQGATEFIPVSSSGHLVIIPKLFGWAADPGLSFDAALHLGTLAAVVFYFWPDLVEIARGGLQGIKTQKGAHSPKVNIIFAVAVASIPAFIAGVFLDNLAETKFRSLFLVAATLAVVGLIMLFAEIAGRKSRPMGAMRLMDWIIIGLAQAVALVPGVSRSGATISAGLFRNLERDTAAKASFLLSIPATAGAAGFSLIKAVKHGFAPGEMKLFVIGILTAGIVGYACIGFLMNYLKRRSINVFVYYRFALAALVVLVALRLV